MTQAELDGYKQQILALARRLQGDTAGVVHEALRKAGGEAAGNLSNVPMHPADLGTDSYEHEVALGLLENERNLLGHIAGALDRLEQGTYGRCVECGQEIGRERLRALPYTPSCVGCAGRLQRAGPQGGAPDVT